jgi:adenine deaminase
MDSTSRLLSVARGDTPADCVLAGGQVINVFTGEIESADIAIADGRIAGIGSGYSGRETIDLRGAFVSPGFIDAHVHLESSLCIPQQFAAAVLPRGVTTVIADPHEIANVAGVAGVRFMFDASRGLPLEVILMAPSCVPATTMSSTGGCLNAADVRELIESGIVRGLAEVMNFPAVIAGDADLLAKIEAAVGRPIDGHAPAVSGKSLSAYAAAGIGSDHECVTADEATEKLRRGLYLLIREATNARNLDALLPAVTPANSRRVCFCTDDRTPVDLLSKGSVDEMVRRAIAAGIEPIEAIRMVTLNTAEMYGLRYLGAIAPGRVANLAVFDELRRPQAKQVFARGKRVAVDGKVASESLPLRDKTIPQLGSCSVDWEKIHWDIPARGKQIRVIGSLPDQLVTEHRILPAKIVEGRAVVDISRDLLKMMVIERHHRTGKFGAGFIQGFGLKRGAIAGTVAHDHHNLVVIGADDASMQTVARAAVASCGGLAVAVGEHVLAHLPLPVGGLMSDRPIADVAADYAKLVVAARELGSPLADPFMAMSFMALEVIPSLKLTDLGLVDVEQFKIIALFANG